MKENQEKNFIGWNPDTNEFYYTSNEESPMRQAVYKIDRKSFSFAPSSGS